ncbi:Oidioi.mRNA.OKI2018_I69.PAR.g10703.t1.cds [Oikopleura dioica]|uniref:Oidioi.mRNA.OKI2018_I69.PAR.g10703.t1.cds n=1 Tax=Oikopleura dioica TaxID=34765 RepID=A0ABN7RW14_OIKDI|nr:Oidioi.mRNA.OKI2018_I69.PAR.g10703.t1.cds [Oikopleura dioica]
MRHTGNTVKLTVIKDAASLYGVDQLLAQPSPTRASVESGVKLNGIRQSQSSYTTINNYYPDKPQIVSAEAPVKLTTELPLPPAHLLEATVNSDGHEYCLPPSKENTPNHRQQTPSDHERDQMVELKPKASPKSQKSDSQSENERTHKDRRSGRRHRDDRANRERKSSRHRERSQEKKKSDAKSANKTGTLTSQSGTLGRKNKGGMWEDPQQRLIQEQLDMMRDEEIIELQNKKNKTASENERLKVLMAEQEFSQRLKRDHIPSGTSEIDSYSEEDVPDRPDRDLLLKIQSQNSLNVHKSAEEETNSTSMADEISRTLELKEKELAEQRKKEEKLAAQLEQQQRELERQQQLEREEEQRAREAEERQRQRKIEEEKRMEDLKRSEDKRLKEQERLLREEQDAQKAAFLAEKEAFEAERRKMEEERAEFLRRQEEFRRMKEEQEQFERERAEFEREQQAQKRELEQRAQQREQELQRKLREEARKKELAKKVDADKFDRQLDRVRRRRASEEDKLSQRRKWLDDQEKLKEVEDDIERVVREASPPRAHPYAAPDAPLPPPPDSVTSNYPPQTRNASISSYTPLLPNHHFTKNKRPLSSYNPKTQEPPQEKFTPLPQKPTVPTTRPKSAYEPTSSPSPDLDESAGVIGTNEIYNDPREKRLANIKRDNSFMRKSQPEPSKLNFRDRAKLFEQSGVSPQTNTKPKMSKKLLELEQQFGSR